MQAIVGLLTTWLLIPAVTLIVLLGLLDMYIFYRFARRPETDSTAAFLNWWKFKWLAAVQTAQFVEKLPFLSKDLSEQLGFEDDGEIT